MPKRYCAVAAAGAAVLMCNIAALCSAAQAQYTPQWNVGDWWLVKELLPSAVDERLTHWQPWRYEVLDIVNVDDHECYVLQQQIDAPWAVQAGVRDLYYVRTDSWRIIRHVWYRWRWGELRGPSTRDYPRGMFGAVRSQPRLPSFPLDTAVSQDSAFQVHLDPFGGGDVRQFSGVADSMLVSRFLDDPDSSYGAPVPLGEGALFSAHIEEGSSVDSIVVPYVYSLQLWSPDYPWRLYEEWGMHPPGGGAREARQRCWLTGCGGAGE